MKILSVCTMTPSNDAQWSRVSNIAKMMESQGHEVHFVHYCRRESYNKIKNVNKLKNHSFIITSPLSVHYKHLKFLRNTEYDLVYANTASSTFISLLGKFTKKPILFDMHGDIVEEFKIENKFSLFSSYLAILLYKNIVNSISSKQADGIITVSHHMLKHLHNNKRIPLKKMFYITNGVNLDVLKPNSNLGTSDLKEQLDIQDKFVFGYIGALDKWQGVDKFIETARKIKDENIIFLIVGWENEKQEKNILYIPRVPFDQIQKYYSICDVLTLPRPTHISTEIAAPTKFAEYTAMGKPILTSNVGDAADFVNEYECGIVTKSNNPKDLIKGIYQFKNLSPKELEKMGKQSRKLAETEFNLNRIANKLSETLKSFTSK